MPFKLLILRSGLASVDHKLVLPAVKSGTDARTEELASAYPQISQNVWFEAETSPQHQFFPAAGLIGYCPTVYLRAVRI